MSKKERFNDWCRFLFDPCCNNCVEMDVESSSQKYCSYTDLSITDEELTKKNNCEYHFFDRNRLDK